MRKAIPPTRAKRRSRRRLVTFLIFVGYAVISLSLLGWELHEQGGLFSSDSCELRSGAKEDSWTLDRTYPFVLDHWTQDYSGAVVVVAIEPALAVMQQNVCTARGFTADLLTAIAAERPSVIAIDKFYGRSSCQEGDVATDKLERVVAGLTMPVVVGQSTHAASEDDAKKTQACLVKNPQLSFSDVAANGNEKPLHKSDVFPGLTRLNEDVLRIPLQWPLLDEDASGSAKTGDSFALTTAQQAEPALADERFKKMLKSADQPYANLKGKKLQVLTATQFLCSVYGKDAGDPKWGITCPMNKKDTVDLQGKVVVLGAESDSDYQSVLGEGMYGVELQARYIAALLSKSYLRQISPAWLLLPLALYYAIAELLIPFLHIHREVSWPLFHIKRTMTWTIGFYLTTMVVGVVGPLLFHRFPPLPMLIAITSILVPRLLIEGWALLNERTEEEREEHTA